MGGTKMLIGRAVGVLNTPARARAGVNQDILFFHVARRPSTAPIYFSFLPSSFAAAYSLKRGSQMPHQQGLPFITRRIHCSLPLLSSVRPSSPPPHNKSGILETLRNALKLCYLIVVMKASTVSSNKRSPTAPPPPLQTRKREKERVTSFLCQATDKSHRGWLVHL